MCRLKLLYSNISAVAGAYSIVRDLKSTQINFGNKWIGRMGLVRLELLTLNTCVAQNSRDAKYWRFQMFSEIDQRSV